ncbi:MAG: GNAT family N-acetyltransferase [Oscillospiraceae bacterium]|nr:GNAT family N-acetyltransferase [Oscillospiraceae bacterium]
MTVRKMRAGDYAGAYELWLSTPGMGVNEVDDSPEGIGRFLSRNPDTCYVALIGDEVVGTVLCGHDGRRALIYHLAVKGSERRKGIGGALLDSALGALKKLGIQKAYAIVYKSNESGNAFWEGHGFPIPEESLYRAREITPIRHLRRSE